MIFDRLEVAKRYQMYSHLILSKLVSVAITYAKVAKNREIKKVSENP